MDGETVRASTGRRGWAGLGPRVFHRPAATMIAVPGGVKRSARATESPSGGGVLAVCVNDVEGSFLGQNFASTVNKEIAPYRAKNACFVNRIKDLRDYCWLGGDLCPLASELGFAFAYRMNLAR